MTVDKQPTAEPEADVVEAEPVIDGAITTVADDAEAEASEADIKADAVDEASTPGLSEPDNVDGNDAVVSAAPPRPHDQLIAQLEIRWLELKDFVRPLQGDVDGELGDVLIFVRGKL